MTALSLLGSGLMNALAVYPPLYYKTWSIYYLKAILSLLYICKKYYVLVCP